MDTHTQIMALQGAAVVLKESLAHITSEQPNALFMNEFMKSLKVIEDTVKEFRKEATSQVDKRNLLLTDFTLSRSSTRSLVKVLDFVKDLEHKWGIPVYDLIERDVLTLKITKAEEIIVETALTMKRIPVDMDPKVWVTSETARYMAPVNTTVISLQRNTRKAHAK